MLTDERLFQVLERWVAEAEAGRLLPVADLCRDCTDLLPEAERQIAVLRRFHVLARATMATTVEPGIDRLPPPPPIQVPDLELPSTNPRLSPSGQHEDTHISRPPGPASPAAIPGLPAVPGYEILGELGRGGMGIVWKARDVQLDREVALKIVRPDVAASPGAAERFHREARALAAVRHDHVVEVYDYGEIDGAHFVAMPLLAGETLDTRLQKQSPLLPTEVVRIGLELADGLAAVHARGLIHRDLKPSNVWLEAPRGRVKLLDFGLARDPGVSDGVTRQGTVVGTPAYMSPEQANGCGLDARSDLFSLGSLLYQAATGQAAFAAPTVTATLAAVGEKEPTPARTVNPAVPAALSALIERLHRKNPADRPASAAEVVRQLHALAAVGEPSPVDYKPGAPATGWFPNTRRHWWPGRARLAVAGALSFFMIGGAILYHSVTNRPQDPAKSLKGPGTTLSEPLRVRKLDVLHLKGMGAKKTQPQGIFGKESFGASPEDNIKVTASLSRPGYCYLIVFRPDGIDEILYPQGSNEVPIRTEEPHYPSKDRTAEYGLDDGTGLWLVALVASDEPLPAYTDWRRQHLGGPWTKSEGEANLIWLDDGNWLEAVTPRGVQNRGSRGEKKAAGASPVVKVVDWLKAETGGTVSAVGFTVKANK